MIVIILKVRNKIKTSVLNEFFIKLGIISK